MSNRRFIIVVICAQILSWTVGAQADTIFQSAGIASSPNPVGSGARALGMGGAFIAVADDATAASWNPAGLVQLERPEMSFVVDYSRRKEEYSSDSRPEIETSSVTNETRINFLSFTFPFSLLNRNMVLSANYQRLYDFERSFDHPRDLAGAVIGEEAVDYNQSGYLGALGLAYALELTSWLSLGATLNIWTDNLGIRNGWTEKVTTQAEITAIDVPGIGVIPLDPPTNAEVTFKDEYENFRGTNWNFGLLWDINRYLSLGAVVKTAFWGDLDHKFTVINRDNDGNVTFTNILTEDAELRLPLSYGAGMSLRLSDSFTMDLDVYRTEWSKYYIEDGQGNKFSGVDGRPKDESNVDDTTQVRLGAEYLFLMPEKHLVIPVRGGVFYDPEPKQGNPEDFYGISVGSGFAYKKFIFDAAYQFRWANNVHGDRLINTGDTEIDVRQHKILASIIIHF
jgi:long-subunit fatty acid transport protein